MSERKMQFVFELPKEVQDIIDTHGQLLVYTSIMLVISHLSYLLDHYDVQCCRSIDPTLDQDTPLVNLYLVYSHLFDLIAHDIRIEQYKLSGDMALTLNQVSVSVESIFRRAGTKPWVVYLRLQRPITVKEFMENKAWMNSQRTLVES